MAACIIVGNADGELGRCDAKCYAAPRHTRCVCVCGGRNHGRGELYAMARARELEAEWRLAGDHVHITTHPAADQLTLWDVQQSDHRKS